MTSQSAMQLALSLTSDILEMIDAGDLERINRLEARRQAAIKRVFDLPVEQIDLLGAQQLRNLNQQVVGKLRLARESIILRQAKLRTATRARQAYLGIDCATP